MKNGIINLIFLLAIIGTISSFSFLAGKSYILNKITVSDICAPQEAIERLARARESHRKQSESEDIEIREFGINCMQSYDRIANLIRELVDK